MKRMAGGVLVAVAVSLVVTVGAAAAPTPTLATVATAQPEHPIVGTWLLGQVLVVAVVVGARLACVPAGAARARRRARRAPPVILTLANHQARVSDRVTAATDTDAHTGASVDRVFR